MKYELVELRIEPGKFIIKKTDNDGIEWWIPMDESNADYQQYLIDTDGGLPTPEETI